MTPAASSIARAVPPRPAPRPHASGPTRTGRRSPRTRRCCCSAAVPTPTPRRACTAPATCPRPTTRRWPTALVRPARRSGDRVVVLGHHYQRDQVIAFADERGDSFALSRFASQADAEFIVFCGVHFMAESAAILGRDDQTVILPDMAAGCSMADMAELRQLVDCWDRLERAGVADDVVPLTYMNSTAAIKAFCGERGGAICTSSNAPRAMQWAFDERAADDGQGALPARPAPRSQHRGARPRAGARRLRGLRPVAARRRADRPAAARRPGGPVEGPLLGPRPLPARDGHGDADAGPRRAGVRPPRVPPRGRARGRQGRLDAPDHPLGRGGTGGVRRSRSRPS